MKIKTNIAFLIFIILVCSACQPTPDKAAVVNKGDGKLESLIAGPAALQQIIMPEESEGKADDSIGEAVTYSEQWKETYTLPNLVCEIDADVILPVTNQYPVFKVRQRNFDTETVGKIVNYFTKGATGVRDTSDTKEELETRLIQARKGVYMWDDNGARWESYEGQKQDIADLEEQIKSAKAEMFSPITDKAISIPMDKTYAMTDDERVYVYADSQNISISSADKFGIIQPESWVVVGDAFPGEPRGTTIANVKISEKEAKETVNGLLSELEIRDYGIAKTEKARIIEGNTYAILSEGWQMTLARNDGNSIPVYINSSETSGLFYYKPEDFVYRWPPECIVIYVDENGPRSFYWAYPMEVVEKMNSNVPIIGFDDIKERIRQYMKFAFAKSTEGAKILEQHIALNKIVLANVLVPMKNEVDYHMSVPAWFFFYEQEDGLGGVYKSVLALNAIDGSNIDLVIRANRERR